MLALLIKLVVALSGVIGVVGYFLWKDYCYYACDACRLDRLSGKGAHPAVPHTCPFARFRHAVWRNKKTGEVVSFGGRYVYRTNNKVMRGAKRV